MTGGMDGLSENREKQLVSGVSDWFSSPDIDEVLLDGIRNFWIVRGGRRELRPGPFGDTEALRRWVVELARVTGTRLDPVLGAAGGSLNNGEYRWHCILPPMAADGPLVSLRRHRFTTLSVSDFAMAPAVRTDLESALTVGAHIIFAGPTGSGKSSLLAALLKRRPASERLFLIESVPELPVVTAGTVRLAPRSANLEGVGAFGLARLLAESLRLLPDRIVIGEVRGDEAPVLIDGMRTGHHGLMATMHASSAAEVVARIGSRLSATEAGWHQSLSAPLAVVLMQRGEPPAVRGVEWIRGS
jgi:pilus assembly protein CpaF